MYSAAVVAKPCFLAVSLVAPHPALNLSSLYGLQRVVERKDARVQGVCLGSVSFFVLVVDVGLREVRVLEKVGKPVIEIVIGLQGAIVAGRALE